ncbi:MAG: DUF1553 domain-containing protein [Acidimicrobiia bacterium]|nr:DUF1553 domain-containing protein [Acidimicrobiia bacterium]
MVMIRVRQVFLAVLAFVQTMDSSFASTTQTSSAAGLQFEKDVLPVFRRNCVRCHGSQQTLRDLDLSSLAGLLKGAESGKVVIPGNAEGSKLYRLLAERRMPMDQPKALTDGEIEIVRRWIQAIEPPSTPEPAAASETEVVALMWMHCAPCHGTRLQEAGLDLRMRASMLKGGNSGPAIVPGHPERSLLLNKLREGQMPPPARYQEANVRPVGVRSVDRLAAWIAAGAPEETEITVETRGGREPSVSDSDRAFWAFQPPRPIDPPVVRDASRVRNPIDAFILGKLEKPGLSLSMEAGRAALLRRACLDLTGMPPEPEEVQAFIDDPDPQAYDKQVDRLLASSRYGERWGRYWLDLAGYRDHPQAWRYRDYVIRSFNADKPYDRFLLEQLAGDELADYENVPVLTPEHLDNLIATGFLRLADDATGTRESNYLSDRMQVVADAVEILGSAVMGLTIGCARCHSHKFDPLPQRDYYRLVAALQGAYDIYDWLPPAFSDDPARKMLNFGYRSLPYVAPATNPLKHADLEAARKAANDALDRQIKAEQDALAQMAKPLRERLLERRLAALPADLHEDLRTMLATPAKERNALQKYLAEKFGAALEIEPEELMALDPSYRLAAEQSARRVTTLEARKQPEPLLRALWDRGEPSPTFVLQRGDPLVPGQRVNAGVPAVLTDGKTPFVDRPPWPGAKKTGRRVALARWLADPKHPLTARVMVNRIWKHHFGEGIVKTLADFGRAGTPPSHPELLDWLAQEFVRCGWSLKSMHRLMMTSSTYQQASRVTAEHEKRDPANALWSRMPLQRMDAEALYDSLLAVSKRLDETLYGPPDAVTTRKDGLSIPAESEKGWRRSIYLRQQQRFGRGVPSLLEAFDFPQMAPNCTERIESTVATQALHLLNDAMVRRLAASLAQRVRAEAGNDSERQIERAYLITVSRLPTREERLASREILRQLEIAWAQERKPEQAQHALETLCHTLINSSAFVYID